MLEKCRTGEILLNYKTYILYKLYNYKHWGKRGFAESGIRAPGGRVTGGDPPGGRRGWIPTTVSPQGGVGPKMRHLVLYKLAGF